jgi:hypothetical protein
MIRKTKSKAAQLQPAALAFHSGKPEQMVEPGIETTRSVVSIPYLLFLTITDNDKTALLTCKAGHSAKEYGH